MDGGSAYPARAGFGRRGRLDAAVFELAGDLPVVAGILVETAIADAGIEPVYAKLPATFGATAR